MTAGSTAPALRRLALLLAAATLAACGLKDDLYLPPPKPAAQPATQPAEPAPDDDEKDEKQPAAGEATRAFPQAALPR